MRHCHSCTFASKLEVTGMNCGCRLRDGLQNPRSRVAMCGSGEMANTLALGASAARLRGSSPLFRTKSKLMSLHRGWPLWLALFLFAKKQFEHVHFRLSDPGGKLPFFGLGFMRLLSQSNPAPLVFFGLLQLPFQVGNPSGFLSS